MLGIANQAAYLGIGYVGLKSISSGLSALVISAQQDVVVKNINVTNSVSILANQDGTGSGSAGGHDK